MELINYKIKEFLQVDEETALTYISYLKHLTPTSDINDLFSLSFKDVEDVKILVSRGLEGYFSALCILQNIDESDILNMRLKRFYRLKNALDIQLEKLFNAEQSLKSRHEDVKWLAVNGGQKMAKYGIYNTLDQLANGDILKYKAILELEYKEVFTKLKMDIERADLQKDMENIKI